MAKRIKLLVDLTGIPEGISHLVYRSHASPVPLDNPLMEIGETQVIKRSLFQEEEELKQEQEAPLYFHVSRVFMMMPVPTVYIDGEAIEPRFVTLIPNERKIRIDGQQIEPDTEKIITMDYHHLVSVIEDDYKITQIGVKHHGTDIISGINRPFFRGYAYNHLDKTLQLSIERDQTPHVGRYNVVHREDRTGRLSEPGEEQVISITPNDFDLRYRLEISRDEGKTWHYLKDFTGNQVVLSDLNDITNYAHPTLPVTITRLSGTRARVSIKNPWYQWWENTRNAHVYRIREEDYTGEISEFMYPIRGKVSYKPIKLKIRRKEHNGTAATYDGLDAIDMWEVKEIDVDINNPTLSFLDDHLVSGRTYSYTFFITDEEEFLSTPFMQTTEY